MKEIKSIEEIKIEELVDGEPLFESHGLSHIKITHDGETKSVVLKIKSTGVADLVDTFSKKAPTPPVRNALVEPNSELGREMRVSKKQWIKMPDYADQDYISKKEKHDQELGMAIMLQGLDITFKNRDGTVVNDPDEKVAILKRQGLTGDQFMQIVNDIQTLTQWDEEEQTHFFGES